MRVLEEQPCGLITAFDRIVVAAWTAIPIDELMAASLLRAGQREAERQGKIAILVVLPPDSPMPTDAVRKRIQEDMRRMDPFVVCGATVIDKAGFRGSALRAVVSTMQLIARPTHPEKVFASAEEAVHFIRGELQRAGFDPPLPLDVLTWYRAIVDRARALGTGTQTSS